MVDYLDHPVCPSHAQLIPLLPLRQAQRTLVVLLHVHCHVTDALVFPEVPKPEIPIVSARDELEFLRPEERRGDSIGMGSKLLDFLI